MKPIWQTGQALAEGEKVSGKVVKIYAAVCNEDDTEGRGKEIDHSYHLSHHNATIGASGIGVMGGEGTVESRLAIVFTDGRHMLVSALIKIADTAAAEAGLRESGRKKLKKAEIAALRIGNSK